MICGVYVVVSPTYRVYVGQSIDIERRFRDYRRLDCKSQIRLYRSLKKHGSENHVFKIAELCEESQLNELERFYQDCFDVMGDMGLNSRLTTAENRSGTLSEDTKKKMSAWQIGKKHSEATKEKMRQARLGVPSPFKGRKHTDTAKAKVSAANKKKTDNE